MINFPKTRLRRNRKAPWIRDLTAQNSLSPSDLILPLFVIEGKNKEEKITHLPDVSRFSIDLIVKKAKEARALGIPALMLFPVVDQKLKTANGKEAINPKNLICRTIAAIKNAVPEIGVIRDALDDAGFIDVALISYAAKYASSFYGPFRHAVGSVNNLKNSDKKGSFWANSHVYHDFIFKIRILQTGLFHK